MVRRDARLLVGLTYVITVLCAGSSMPSPLYAQYARVYGLAPFAITAMFAGYVAALIPVMVFCGGLSDVWGRRRVIVLGLALSASGSLVFAAAPDPAVLYAARGLQGTALGLSSAAVTATLADIASPKRLGALLASVGISAGSAAGPLLSGLIAQVAPAPLRTPFLVHVVLLTPALLLIRRLPESPTRPWRPRWPRIPRPILRTFLRAAGSTALAWSLLGLFLAVVPSLVGALGHPDDPLLAGGLVTLMLVSSMAAQSGSGLLPSRRHRTVALLTMCTGTSVLALASGTGNVAVLGAAAVVVGSGVGLGSAAALATVTVAAPAHRRAEVVSALYLVAYTALALPVLGAGALAGWLGFRLTITGLGALGTAAGLVLLAVGRRTAGVDDVEEVQDTRPCDEPADEPALASPAASGR